MANYVKATDFAAKDSLTTGDPQKIIKGQELNDEFNAIQTAVATKADTNSPTLLGNPTAPTQTTGNNSTRIASTQFVNNSISAAQASANITGGTIDGVAITGGTVSGLATDLAVADGGTGASSIPLNQVVLGNNGSSLAGNTVAPGTAGNVLTSNGTTWESQPAALTRVSSSLSSLSFGITYTAATDGFVVANATNGGAVLGGFTILIDGVTRVWSRSTSEGASGWQTGMFPVRAGQTYRANLTGAGASALGLFFIPFGA